MTFDWNAVVDKLKTDSSSLHMWLEKSTAVYDEKENKLLIEVPSLLHKKNLTDKYTDEILSIVAPLTSASVTLNIEIKKGLTSKTDASHKITIKDVQIPLPLDSPGGHIPYLNTKFKFDNFIVGDSNRFAHAASKAVAEAPGQTYNPLFIYGGVGLGKTHLLHAIGNYVYEHNPQAKILITTAEKFIIEVVSHIGSKKMDEFKEKYRSVDLLLVDDIEFLQKGEQAREEFFHTFNELSNLNKQIVATSDSPPSELKLEDRLKSRFAAGIIADIQSPNFETRTAILRLKAKEMNRVVPDVVLAFIAENVDSNVRLLGATFSTMVALANQPGFEINIDLAKQALKLTNPAFESNKKIGIDLIQQVVAGYYDIKVQDLSSRKRPENIANARQIAMYITRNLTEYSLVQIGQYFGGKDHTTVMHAIKKVEHLIKSDDKFRATLDELIVRIKK
jgi:chromosomal replication initiator protein